MTRLKSALLALSMLAAVPAFAQTGFRTNEFRLLHSGREQPQRVSIIKRGVLEPKLKRFRDAPAAEDRLLIHSFDKIRRIGARREVPHTVVI